MAYRYADNLSIVLFQSVTISKLGFDKLMPEGRRFPWKYIPRLGVKLSVTFGEPLSPEEIKAALRALSWEEDAQKPLHRARMPANSHAEKVDRAVDGEDKLFGGDHVERVREGVTRESISMDLEGEERKQKIERVRSMVTAVIQRGVEALGRRVSGNTLGKDV